MLDSFRAGPSESHLTQRLLPRIFEERVLVSQFRGSFVSTTKEIVKEILKIAEVPGCVSNFASALIFLRENAENHRVPRDH